ncbi:unnamed protein product [Miscanthus lutarioriparius]|uniref:Uncharacterized protein n=1 Tax=Miscanthus lutarioriparius TaxID=422564 RepID=A0A811S425_9POAL|nr:unnamed protein product [Miscanthus lutarioriparius]
MAAAAPSPPAWARPSVPPPHGHDLPSPADPSPAASPDGDGDERSLVERNGDGGQTQRGERERPASLGRRSAKETASNGKPMRERRSNATWPSRTRRTASAEKPR